MLFPWATVLFHTIAAFLFLHGLPGLWFLVEDSLDFVAIANWCLI